MTTTTSTAPAAATTPRVRALPDALLSTVGGAMLLLALLLALVGGEGDTTRRPLVAPPVLELLLPLAGAEIDGPVMLVFRASRPLQAHSAGWGVDDFHLHALLDGKEVMPNAMEVVPIEQGRYRWVVRLPAGEHEVRLYWAGPDHRALPGGTEPRAITVR